MEQTPEPAWVNEDWGFGPCGSCLDPDYCEVCKGHVALADKGLLNTKHGEA